MELARQGVAGRTQLEKCLDKVPFFLLVLTRPQDTGPASPGPSTSRYTDLGPHVTLTHGADERSTQLGFPR